MRCALHEGCLKLEGAVTVHTLTAPRHRQFTELAARADRIDLSGVSQADSACAALLLAARRGRNGAPPALTGLPEAVRALAGLYDICDWIPAWTPDTPAPLSFSHSS